MKDFGDNDILPNTYTGQQAPERIRSTIATPQALLKEQDVILRALLDMRYTPNSQGATEFFKQQIELTNAYNDLAPISTLSASEILRSWNSAFQQCSEIPAATRTATKQKWDIIPRNIMPRGTKSKREQSTTPSRILLPPRILRAAVIPIEWAGKTTGIIMKPVSALLPNNEGVGVHLTLIVYLTLS